MAFRSLHIHGPGRLTVSDRHLVFLAPDRPERRAPLEDLGVVVLDGPDLLISAPVFPALAESRAVAVLSDARHLPAVVALPLSGHTLTAEIQRKWLAATEPRRKTAWQVLIRAKIVAQADLLRELGRPDPYLYRMASAVRSGDPDNREGAAAARYFRRLMPEPFIRRPQPCLSGDDGDPNGLLNYGYALLRAACARSAAGAGLPLGFGLFHANRYNPLALADDLIEPLRPAIDRLALQWIDLQSETDVTPRAKRHLQTVFHSVWMFDGKPLPFYEAVDRYATGLRRSVLERETLRVPVWRAHSEDEVR